MNVKTLKNALIAHSRALYDNPNSVSASKLAYENMSAPETPRWTWRGLGYFEEISKSCDENIKTLVQRVFDADERGDDEIRLTISDAQTLCGLKDVAYDFRIKRLADQKPIAVFPDAIKHEAAVEAGADNLMILCNAVDSKITSVIEGSQSGAYEHHPFNAAEEYAYRWYRQWVHENNRAGEIFPKFQPEWMYKRLGGAAEFFRFRLSFALDSEELPEP